MRKKYYLYIFFILVLLQGCKETKSYFCGDLVFVNDIHVADTLKGEKVNFDSLYFGLMSVSDSLMFFYNPRAKDYQYRCFNVKTGKFICHFFPIGRGANEFQNVTPIAKVYNENGDIKSLFTAINENKAGVFNITKSLEQKTTVLDTVFDFIWSEKYIKPFTHIFKYNDSTVLAYKPPTKINLTGHRYSVPQYLKLNHKTNDTERVYDLYNDPSVVNDKAERLNENFYASFGLLSPDGRKIAMGMNMLAQINILDIETGELKGIRISETPEFDYFKGKLDDLRFYYKHLDVDDRCIYALYADKSYSDFQKSPESNIINVFDWNGNFLHKLYLNNGTDQIQLDSVNRLLYGLNFATGDVFCYRIPF